MQKEYSLVLSLVALALSFVAITGIHCFEMNASEAVLTIVGICTTLIVGVSVVDAIAVRRLGRKIEELDKLEDKVRKLTKQSNILFHYTWGIQHWKERPYTALCDFWRAFSIAAETDDIKRAKSCLANMEKLSKEISEKLVLREALSKENIELVPREVPKSMKDSKVYCAFDVRIKILIEKINKELIKEQ